MKGEKKDITIYDIAEKVNLSSSTVSRALNDSPSISEKTKKKVTQAAKELGYRQNNFASSLRKQKSHTIGVITHELQSNFITLVLAGIEKACSGAGYSTIIVNSFESLKNEKHNAENLFHRRVDGIIASLSFETDNLDHFKPYQEKNIPIVFFDRVEEDSDTTKVIIDNYRSGYQATKHLIEQGCRRIMMINGSQKRNVYNLRYRGYKEALAAANLDLDENLVFINDLSEDAVHEVIKQITKLKKMPDGAFITNDFTAAVFIKAVKQLGYRVPEDIAVVGFNNDAVSRIVEPELTTISYPGFLVGETAANSLINHLDGKTNLRDVYTIVLNSELIVRKSSLKSSSAS